MKKSFSEIVAIWEFRAELLRRHRALVDGASMVEDFLDDLKALSEREAQEALTISQAAIRSGYSTDHLRRLVRDGKLSNVGRKHSPRVMAADLPRRVSRALPPKSERSYDPSTDARSLRVRR